jgi:hypothetical protein
MAVFAPSTDCRIGSRLRVIRTISMDVSEIDRFYRAFVDHPPPSKSYEQKQKQINNDFLHSRHHLLKSLLDYVSREIVSLPLLDH